MFEAYVPTNYTRAFPANSTTTQAHHQVIASLTAQQLGPHTVESNEKHRKAETFWYGLMPESPNVSSPFVKTEAGFPDVVFHLTVAGQSMFIKPRYQQVERIVALEEAVKVCRHPSPQLSELEADSWSRSSIPCWHFISGSSVLTSRKLTSTSSGLILAWVIRTPRILLALLGT